MTKTDERQENIRNAKFLNTLKMKDVPLNGEVHWLQHHFASNDMGKFSLKFHKHTFWELHAVLEGSVEYTLCESRPVSLKKGEYILFPPNTPHAFNGCTKDYEKISLAFSLGEAEKDTERPVSIQKMTPLFLSSVERILYLEEQKNRTLTPLFGNEAVFIIHLLGLFSPCKDALPAEEDMRFEKARQFIHDNRILPIAAKDAASFVHLSERQLCRLFLGTEGISLSAFIRKERCAAIKERLSETEQPLREIAEALSFSNEYNLIRFFRSEEGMSPGAYRRAAKP